MKHSALTAMRTLFRKTFILSLASLCLLALFGLTQRANVADNPDTPTVLGSICGVVTDANGVPLANLDVLVSSIRVSLPTH